MDDSLKHIDELFRSQLGSAVVTPPPGVFEQCVEQLHATGTEGQGLNHAATQQGVPSGLGNAVGSAGKTIFGLSAKASVAILGSLVAAVLVVSAIVKSHAIDSKVKDGNEGTISKAEVQKNLGQNAAGLTIHSGNRVATDAKNHVEIGDETSDANARNSALDKPGTISGHARAIPALRKDEVERKNGVGGEMSMRSNGGLGIQNASTGIPSKSVEEKAVNKPNDNANKVQKSQSNANNNPCQSNNNQWKPVISDVVGGIVSLGIEGKYDRMRIDWADGERSEVLTDQVGIERMSHQYWVDHGRTFKLKLVNERKVVDARGLMILCRDSQRLAVTISPTGDATDIVVPDVFTPNGDGLNEEFYIGMAQPQMFDMCVFDLNNRLIFRSDKYDAKWKGFCGSSLCPEGIYRVVISYKYSSDKSLKYARKSVKLIYNSNQ